MSDEKRGEMVIVANVGDVAEGQIYKGILETAGIPCFLQGENHRSLLGVLGAYIELNLMVPAELEQEAILILEDAAKQEFEFPEGLGESEEG